MPQLPTSWYVLVCNGSRKTYFMKCNAFLAISSKINISSFNVDIFSLYILIDGFLNKAHFLWSCKKTKALYFLKLSGVQWKRGGNPKSSGKTFQNSKSLCPPSAISNCHNPTTHQTGGGMHRKMCYLKILVLKSC